MKRLLPVLMGFALLLLSSTEGWSLPPCKGSPTSSSKITRNWTDCFGTFTYTHGTKYVGQWKDGKGHGQGTMTYADREKYVGQWKSGMKHGLGTETLPNGKVKEGIWEYGNLVKRLTKEEWVRAEKHRIVREKQQKKQRIVRQKQQKIEQIAREKRIASNPGFRDLKPGLHRSTIKKKKVCKGSLNNKSGTTCYSLQNLKFSGTFNRSAFLDKLTVDLGPIVGSVGFINQLSTYIQKGETNIYLKMRNSLGAKYKMDFEFSERDRQLFNEGVKDKLYTVYNGGQVALLINRKKRGYSRDLWLYVEYRDVKPAQRFLKSTKPKRAKASDF